MLGLNNIVGDQSEDGTTLVSAVSPRSICTSQDNRYPLHKAIALKQSERRLSGAAVVYAQCAFASVASCTCRLTYRSLSALSFNARPSRIFYASWRRPSAAAASRSKGGQIKFRSEVVGGRLVERVIKIVNANELDLLVINHERNGECRCAA